MNNVDVAVINSGGRGMRFRPFTNTIPKEMLPFNGVPSIEYVIDECINASIDRSIVTTSRENDQIKLYLESREKYANRLYFNFENFEDTAHGIWICTIDNRKMYGNATPILALENLLKHKKFAVLFGDDVIYEKNGIGELIRVYKDKKATSAIAMKEIPLQYMHDFGNLKIDENDRVHSFVQKPQCIEDVVSEYAVISRLILDDSIFEYIDITNTELKEVDLGNALDIQAKEKLVVAYELTGQWLSVDSPSRYFLSQKKIIHNYI